MDQSTYKFLKEVRAMCKAQLGLLNGQRNPFDGRSDWQFLVNSPQAKAEAESWIGIIDSLIGVEDAARS